MSFKIIAIRTSRVKVENPSFVCDRAVQIDLRMQSISFKLAILEFSGKAF
ncbi:MAG: hypothetical protein SAK29_41960 [Scytonema sp. PMC 1069.18]|nr:hypothetical protein [Scytonema sp. PMC 1069.18]MEC4886304.1 hypothetical protein [Scytonema sp. PMC 1070.18]